LILLIQHISTMLQAPQIAAAAGKELFAALSIDTADEVVTDEVPGDADQKSFAQMKENEGYPVCVKRTGYIQYVNPEILLTLSQEKDLVVRMLRRPGDFVWKETQVALVWPASRMNERFEMQIQRAFQIGNQRTPTQDTVYAVNQLVEMAVRAMSPAINDPFTALTCLDYLGQGLALFARQKQEDPYVYDKEGQLRLVFEPVDLEELFNAAFDMIRHASCDNARVLLHMLEVIDSIQKETSEPQVIEQLLCHADLIQAESQAGALIEQDRKLIAQRYKSLIAGLQAPEPAL
jgi:uncharacterized membrane protein